MRADIKFMSLISLPQTTIVSSFLEGGAPLTPENQDDRGKLVFSGNGRVQSITHYGDSRSASGDSWVTVLVLLVGKLADNPIGTTGQ